MRGVRGALSWPRWTCEECGRVVVRDFVGYGAQCASRPSRASERHTGRAAGAAGGWQGYPGEQQDRARRQSPRNPKVRATGGRAGARPGWQGGGGVLAGVSGFGEAFTGGFRLEIGRVFTGTMLERLRDTCLRCSVSGAERLITPSPSRGPKDWSGRVSRGARGGP